MCLLLYIKGKLVKDMDIIKRGDILLANLSPVMGCEQGGIRPVLVIQNDKGNCYSNTIIVSAITTHMKGKNYLPTHYILSNKQGLNEHSVVLLEQIKTIDKQRIIKKLCSLNTREMNMINHCLKISIGIH